MSVSVRLSQALQIFRQFFLVSVQFNVDDASPLENDINHMKLINDLVNTASTSLLELFHK